jgi:hypothetical protein
MGVLTTRKTKYGTVLDKQDKWRETHLTVSLSDGGVGSDHRVTVTARINGNTRRLVPGDRIRFEHYEARLHLFGPRHTYHAEEIEKVG